MFGELEDVYFTFEKRRIESYCQFCKSAVRDMAILSLCNHSIVTYGTFSFWSSYLKPSTHRSITIVPTGYSMSLHPILTAVKYIPTWKEMNDPCWVKNEYNRVILSSDCVKNAKKYGISKDDVKTTEKENPKVISFVKFRSCNCPLNW